MRQNFTFFNALMLLLLWGCSDQDAAQPGVVKVDDYQQVSIAGNIVVRFKQEETISDKNNEVHIISSAYQDQLTVSSKDGELRIVGDNISLEEQVIVEIYPGPLDAIRLESGQKAVFEGVIIQPALAIVTEGNSELELYGLQVDAVEAKLEADSKLVLSTFLETKADSVDFPEADAVQINDYTLQYNRALVKGDSVKLITVEDHTVWRIYGEEIDYYYYPATVNFRTEGEVILHAVDTPVEEVHINLQGHSQATVWATGAITGKGEGESKLTYRGEPATTGFILQGGAQMLKYQE